MRGKPAPRSQSVASLRNETVRGAPHVLERHVDSTSQDRVDLGGQNDRLRGARARAEPHAALGGFGALGQVGVASQDEPNGVVSHV